jgi:hypothetical protein
MGLSTSGLPICKYSRVKSIYKMVNQIFTGRLIYFPLAIFLPENKIIRIKSIFTYNLLVIRNDYFICLYKIISFDRFKANECFYIKLKSFRRLSSCKLFLNVKLIFLIALWSSCKTLQRLLWFRPIWKQKTR